MSEFEPETVGSNFFTNSLILIPLAQLETFVTSHARARTHTHTHTHKDLKRDIVDSVSTLRNIFVNLKNSAEEQMAKIDHLESEVKKAKAELQQRRAVALSIREPPPREGSGKTLADCAKHVLPSVGGARKLYSSDE